jgi:protein SCO1/2
MNRFAAPTCALAIAVACALSPARAQGIAAAAGDDGPLTPVPGAPAISLSQRLDAELPLRAPFTDSAGRPILLGDDFAAAGRVAPPVILVLGYYRCPQLCGLLMQGLLEAVHASGLPATSYRIVFASIDPADTPADAAIRRRVALDYARFLDAGAEPPAIDLLVGAADSIAALAHSVGYAYQAAIPVPVSVAPGFAAPRFGHPAGIVICTSDGRVSRYLMGVRFDPRELRAALVDAGGGRIGNVTDRIALLCAHLDPHLGRWSEAVLAGMRVLGAATMLLVGLLVWRRRASAREGGA